MRRLERPCFLLRGNHDARSVSPATLLRPVRGILVDARLRRSPISSHYSLVPDVRPGLRRLPAAGRRHAQYRRAPRRLRTRATQTYAPAASRDGHQGLRLLGARPSCPRLAERLDRFPGIARRHPRKPGEGCAPSPSRTARCAVEHRPVDVLRWAREVDTTGVDVATLTGRMRCGRCGARRGRWQPVLARVTLVAQNGCCKGTPSVLPPGRSAAFEADGRLFVESVRAHAAGSVAEDDVLAPLVRRGRADDPAGRIAGADVAAPTTAGPTRADLEIPRQTACAAGAWRSPPMRWPRSDEADPARPSALRPSLGRDARVPRDGAA